MSGPQRAPDQTAISVSIGKELLTQIDARASTLGLSRSQYLAQLARNDVKSGGDLILKEGLAESVPAAARPATYKKKLKPIPAQDHASALKKLVPPKRSKAANE